MKLFVLLLIVFNTTLCFAQNFVKKQTLIPLDNSKGVPFRKDPEIKDYSINGFEVDSNANFYFLGGEKLVCVAAFRGNKLIYRQTYKDMPLGTGQLYLNHDTLFTFNRLPPNSIFAINPVNGLLLKIFKNTVTEKINSYNFLRNHLIIQSIGISNIPYFQYTLTGKQIGQASNKYNLPFVVPANCEFLGTWNDKFVFYMISGNNFDKQKFFVTDKSGNILATKLLANNNIIFGEGYAEDPPEDRKVRNGNLYVLGRKGNFALITEIPLQSFFGRR